MKHLFLAFIILMSFKAQSQGGLKDYKTVFYKEISFENDDYKLYLVKCFSRADILKVKVRVFNKTKDVIYIKPEEFTFSVNGKTIKGYGRILMVQPDGEESHIVDVKGDGDMRCEKFEVVLGGFYKVNLAGDVYTTANSEIPAKQGSKIETGPFTCELSTTVTNKEKSFAKYDCVYNGDKIGVIEPNKSTAIMSSGKENYNSFPKNDVFILEKAGAPAHITIEFRKMNGAGDLTDGYKVKWNDAFKASKLTSLKTITVPMVADIEKSEK